MVKMVNFIMYIYHNFLKVSTLRQLIDLYSLLAKEEKTLNYDKNFPSVCVLLEYLTNNNGYIHQTCTSK